MQSVLCDKGKRTLIDLLLGMMVLCLVALLGNLIASNKLAYTLGVFLGLLTASLMCIHMYKSLNRILLFDKKRAKAKARLAAFFRMLMMVAALMAAALLPDYLSVVGVFLGILSLKLAAEMQPLTDKLVIKIFKIQIKEDD